MENVIYDVKDCAEAIADEGFRRECIDLYSAHYGIWGNKAGTKLAGRHVQLSDKLFNTSKVNISFFVDHSDVPQQIMNVRNTAPWLLGDLEDGWEWFAFTFREQETIELQPDEIKIFLDTSDSIVKRAYARMQLQSKEQKWMQHTADEVDYILKNVDILSGAKIYDLGCGVGRHSIELAKRGFYVTGIDYIESHIKQAQRDAAQAGVGNVQFRQDDCRRYRDSEKAELVICLYDVVGSFADLNSNIEILRTAFDLLIPGGYFVLSVMNYDLTYSQSKYCFDFSKEPSKIFTLMPSNIMERTGNVFDPEYYLVDTVEHVIYRKEQFSLSKSNLPAELLVRDRRFTQTEINAYCRKIGFSDVKSKFVNASSWEDQYASDDPKAKEILLICTK